MGGARFTGLPGIGSGRHRVFLRPQQRRWPHDRRLPRTGRSI